MTVKDHSDTSDGRAVWDIGETPARYLFAISRSSTGVEDLVRTGEIQESLGVTPASVSEMIANLDAAGYVQYEKYQGVRLANRGDALAERVSLRFCIVSSFFESMLDLALDEQTVFEIAFRLPKDAIISLRDLNSASCLDICPESRHGSEGCVA